MLRPFFPVFFLKTNNRKSSLNRRSEFNVAILSEGSESGNTVPADRININWFLSGRLSNDNSWGPFRIQKQNYTSLNIKDILGGKE